jgi:hypothetical protein
MKKNLAFICIVGIIFAIFNLISNPGFCSTDFIAYWSSSHILVSGGNPYDQTTLSNLEQSICPGLSTQGGAHLNTWNPPWLLLIFIPLGLLPYPIAALVWTFINTFLIGLSLIIFWQLSSHGENPRGILFVFLAGFVFIETLATITIGQITPIVMLSVILFILCIDHRLDFYAGSILLFALIKPQVTYFFILVVLIWIIKKRRWKIIAGFCITLFISLVIYWVIIPNWVSKYIDLLNSMPYYSLYTSTFGSFIDAVFHIKWFYLAGILLIFVIKPVLRIVERDGWFTAMNMSILVSLPLSPFGFSFDQIVILPAITQIISWLWAVPYSRKFTLPVSASLALVFFLDLGLHSIKNIENYWFFQIPILFFAIYFFTWKKSYAD